MALIAKEVHYNIAHRAKIDRAVVPTDTAVVFACVDRALQMAVPTIFNSDQGSHFTSPQCVERVLGAGALVSMDGRGRAIDNIFTGRLWRTVKYEHVYLNDYAVPKEARQGIEKYLRFYCETRPHQSLGYKRPIEVYRAGVTGNPST